MPIHGRCQITLESFSDSSLNILTVMYLDIRICAVISIPFFLLILIFTIDLFSQLYDCVFTAIGVGSGIATSIIPFMILFVVWLCTRTCLVKKKLIVDMYDASERERAMTHLITHLLTVSRLHVHSVCLILPYHISVMTLTSHPPVS